MQPNLGKFNCENCHYTCRNKCDYNKHLSTRKHLNASKTANKSPKHFACEICNKTYIHRSSLCKHKKTCKQNSASSPNITGSIQEASPRASEIEILSNLVKELIKSNQETQLQNQEARKSMRTLIDWKKNNPDYEDIDSKFSQDCLSMQRNSMAGYERETVVPKVI